MKDYFGTTYINVDTFLKLWLVKGLCKITIFKFLIMMHRNKKKLSLSEWKVCISESASLSYSYKIKNNADVVDWPDFTFPHLRYIFLEYIFSVEHNYRVGIWFKYTYSLSDRLTCTNTTIVQSLLGTSYFLWNVQNVSLFFLFRIILEGLRDSQMHEIKYWECQSFLFTLQTRK